MSKKLKTYEVYMHGDFGHTFQVQAKDEDDASEKAMEQCDKEEPYVSLNWQYDNIDVMGEVEDE